jgi:alpha-glucosidase (family GH31 glycosyl hydrolase)
VNRTWGGLQSQPEIALQMGMQGLAYMHSDLGGFAGDNLDDELYVRWLQYGVFNPIFRPHAQEGVASEPVFRSDKAKALAKEAIELRYRMLPYNYNLMYENNQFGKPLMRPLFFEESNNIDLLNYSKTYLWGNDILVSPVLESGKTEQEVYFPKNSVWFDGNTDERIEGGQTKTVQLKENSIPTYARAGAFIPMAKPMQSTTDYYSDNFELHYYFDKSSPVNQREFYNDNGKSTNAIKNRNYELMVFDSGYKGSNLKFELKYYLWHEDGKTKRPSDKTVDFIVHNIQKEPKYVKVDGKKIAIYYDLKTKMLRIPITWKAETEKEIKIKLKR